jgi:hypothetical protein
MQKNEAVTDSEQEAQAQEASHAGDGWAAKCVREALTARTVPAAVSELLTEQLAGAARERPLKNSELAAIAQTLIARLNEAPAGKTVP